MARCTPRNLIHERGRWEQMDNFQLRRRLQKMSVPSKLACFLNVACARQEYGLAMDAVERCNDLNMLAVEVSPQVFSVVNMTLFPNQSQEIPSFVLDDVPRVRPDRIDSPSTSPTATSKSSTSEFIKATLDAMDEGVEEVKPKKRKSLYSRKLRVRRR